MIKYLNFLSYPIKITGNGIYHPYVCRLRPEKEIWSTPGMILYCILLYKKCKLEEFMFGSLKKFFYLCLRE